VKLVCVTDNNGFLKGQKMPVQSVFRTIGADSDGRPGWFIRETDQSIIVFILSANTDFSNSAFSIVTFTPSQWKLEVRCADLEAPV